jgi:hypothetical protein
VAAAGRHSGGNGPRLPGVGGWRPLIRVVIRVRYRRCRPGSLTGTRAGRPTGRNLVALEGRKPDFRNRRRPRGRRRSTGPPRTTGCTIPPPPLRHEVAAAGAGTAVSPSLRDGRYLRCRRFRSGDRLGRRSCRSGPVQPGRRQPPLMQLPHRPPGRELTAGRRARPRSAKVDTFGPNAFGPATALPGGSGRPPKLPDRVCAGLAGASQVVLVDR